MKKGNDLIIPPQAVKALFRFSTENGKRQTVNAHLGCWANFLGGQLRSISTARFS
jgi:hypothetical protein